MAPPQNGPETVFLPGEEVFARPGPAAPSQRQTQYRTRPVNVHCPVGPLTSSPSSRGRSSGGALWRAGYAPVDRLTSWVYSTTFVQYLYISCYLSENKSVLLYLLLRLLPQCQYRIRQVKQMELKFYHVYSIPNNTVAVLFLYLCPGCPVYTDLSRLTFQS
jgi:hypothetical protein